MGTTKTERATPAIEGQTFSYDGSDFVVAPACPANVGHWFCITHMVGFVNQLQKDSHIARGRHVLTWVCFEHGPEVP